MGAVYALLSDSAKRALYDDSGEVDEEGDLLSDPSKDWAEYWRKLFHKVTHGDVAKFEEEYRGSDEEKKAIGEAYTEAKGNMGQVLDNVMSAREEDEGRFRKVIQQMIEDGELDKFKAFGQVDKKEQTKRKRAAEAEAAEAEEAAAELGLGGSEDGEGLRALILARQGGRAQQADDLAAKYAPMPKKAKKAKK